MEGGKLIDGFPLPNALALAACFCRGKLAAGQQFSRTMGI